MSILRLSCGTQKLWITSAVVAATRTIHHHRTVTPCACRLLSEMIDCSPQPETSSTHPTTAPAATRRIALPRYPCPGGAKLGPEPLVTARTGAIDSSPGSRY